jgi:catechol 2,3-dioxygenase-like lactoylglutathione lyase family enzyme
MKRFHVHVGVDDLAANIRFYSKMFRAEPAVLKDDYAKWMIDEPRINFAISRSTTRTGVSHLGLQADTAEELADIRSQFAAADPDAADEPNAACCYARSDKHWATDPQGLRWEGFHSRGLLEDELVTEAAASNAAPAPGGCCAPKAAPNSAATATRNCCNAS